ncbi:MAG: hypothetical protein ACRD0P_02935 [Stackebrandtia sp.]
MGRNLFGEMSTTTMTVVGTAAGGYVAIAMAGLVGVTASVAAGSLVGGAVSLSIKHGSAMIREIVSERRGGNPSGSTVADIKADLEIAKTKAQNGIDKYLSARSGFEQALAELRNAMEGSSHGAAAESQSGVERVITGLDAAVAEVRLGLVGYDSFAENL